jgi:hypothetical protein
VRHTEALKLDEARDSKKKFENLVKIKKHEMLDIKQKTLPFDFNRKVCILNLWKIVKQMLRDLMWI